MITDPAAREHVAGVWGIEPEQIPGPGRSAAEMFGALGTEIRALLVFGANPVVSAPRSLPGGRPGQADALSHGLRGRASRY